VPKNRTQLPTLIDFALARGLVTYRTTSGKILRIALDRIVARATGDDTPIVLQGNGTYNDVAATFDATFESSVALHDAGKLWRQHHHCGKDTTTPSTAQ
jgi:hypothetical protein